MVLCWRPSPGAAGQKEEYRGDPFGAFDADAHPWRHPTWASSMTRCPHIHAEVEVANNLRDRCDLGAHAARCGGGAGPSLNAAPSPATATPFKVGDRAGSRGQGDRLFRLLAPSRCLQAKKHRQRFSGMGGAARTRRKDGEGCARGTCPLSGRARIARQKEIDASIAAKAEHEYLYDKPYEDKKRVRVAGPFHCRGLSPHRMSPVDEHGPRKISSCTRSMAGGGPARARERSARRLNYHQRAIMEEPSPRPPPVTSRQGGCDRLLRGPVCPGRANGSRPDGPAIWKERARGNPTAPRRHLYIRGPQK